MLPIKLTLLKLYFLSLIQTVFSDVYTAVIKMEMLAKVERDMLNELYTLVTNSEIHGYEIPDSVLRFESRTKDLRLLSPQPHYLENPINAFHFIHRMYIDWTRVLADINCDDCIETSDIKVFNENIFILQNTSIVGIRATEKDYHGTALGLVRLWQTYKLDLQALFRGEILDTKTSPLTSAEIFAICGSLDDRNQFYKEIVWLQEFLKYIATNQMDEDVTPNKVTRLLASSYAKYGMPWIAEKLISDVLSLDPDNKILKRDMQYFKAKSSEIPVEERTQTLHPDEEDSNKAHYESLCRGKGIRSTRVTSRLKCFLRETDIPLYWAKEEVMSLAPRLSVFYDVTTEKEREYLKDIVLTSLSRSMVVGEDTGESLYNYRVSETAWVADWYSPMVRHVTRKVQLITGLSTQMSPVLSHAENMQVLNYGVGGMYEKHLDYFGGDGLLYMGRPRQNDDEIVKGSGDRLATWMFYLSDVKAGGATVYTSINVTVPVVKGAAAFWYNIRRGGDYDERTYHAGCPVLLGSKWVGNKWIRENGQMFRRICGLSPNSIDVPYK